MKKLLLLAALAPALMASAAGADDLVGTYKMQELSFNAPSGIYSKDAQVFGTVVYETGFDVTVVAGEAENSVVFKNLLNKGLDWPATVDPDTKTITFAVTDCFDYFQLAKMGKENDGWLLAEVESATATYTEDKTITFTDWTLTQKYDGTQYYYVTGAKALMVSPDKYETPVFDIAFLDGEYTATVETFTGSYWNSAEEAETQNYDYSGEKVTITAINPTMVSLENFPHGAKTNATVDTEAKTLTFAPQTISPFYSYTFASTTGDTASVVGTYDDEYTITINDWAAWSGVYYYAGFDAEGKPNSKTTLTKGYTGVSPVLGQEVNAPVEYFNLQGVRASGDQPGLYIVRQGNKARKIVVR